MLSFLLVLRVEPGKRLAEQIRARHPAGTVVVARAEDMEFPAGSFDVAVAATSIHWMDLGIVLPKVRQMLTPEGVLLVWRTVFGDPDAAVTPFRERVAQIVRERGAPARSGDDAENADATAAALTASSLFTVDQVDTFRWSIDLHEDHVRRLFTTFSNWSPAEADRAAAAARELGGTVTEHYLSWLIALRPTPN